jgi:signal transduction histidine kinase
VLEVIDTGTGIPADVLPRVFDPFFSTKDEGHGSGLGLGLAICKRIIDQHHGTLEIESAPGRERPSGPRCRSGTGRTSPAFKVREAKCEFFHVHT